MRYAKIISSTLSQHHLYAFIFLIIYRTYSSPACICYTYICDVNDLDIEYSQPTENAYNAIGAFKSKCLCSCTYISKWSYKYMSYIYYIYIYYALHIYTQT